MLLCWVSPFLIVILLNGTLLCYADLRVIIVFGIMTYVIMLNVVASLLDVVLTQFVDVQHHLC